MCIRVNPYMFFGGVGGGVNACSYEHMLVSTSISGLTCELPFYLLPSFILLATLIRPYVIFKDHKSIFLLSNFTTKSNMLSSVLAK